MVAVMSGALLGFLGVTAVKVVTTLYIRFDNNKEYAKMQLNVPLLEHEKLDREQLARSYDEPRVDLSAEWLLVGDPTFSGNTGLFTLVDKTDQTFYLNHHSKERVGDDHLTYYFAAGRLPGKGLLDGTQWGFHLATPLLKLVLGQPVSFTDLEFFDPEEYKSLEWLVKNNGAEALDLDFSVTEVVNGEVAIVDLVPHGRDIPVTDSNKTAHLDRRFKYTVFESVSEQLYAFLKGIYEVVPQEMLMVLDPDELDFIMCGSDVIDVDDWKLSSKNNECIHGHPCMRWFWKFVRNMSLEYKKRLLHFTTGNTRVPVGGFAALTNYSGHVTPLTILGNGLVVSRLIRSNPCFNQIELPNYVRKRDLKAMLFGILDNYEYALK
ncbi:hypothetical protein Gpo141_00013237 [Globisporangium polare]